MHFLLTDFMLPNTMTPQIPGLCGSTVRGTVGLCISIYIFQYIYLHFTFSRSLSDLKANSALGFPHMTIFFFSGLFVPHGHSLKILPKFTFKMQ